MKSTVTALVPWFGSNRLLAANVGAAVAGCRWVGVPFAGGMCELLNIDANILLVNDLHRHVINLARVVAHDESRRTLIRRLRRKLFHPDELAAAQEMCRPGTHTIAWPNIDLAEAYFVCSWMNRSGKAGTKGEFTGNVALRWKAGGGDSAVRYHSAIRGLAAFAKVFRRCTFSTMDAFEFLAKCPDLPKHAIYCDPPFPTAGQDYVHNAGADAAERGWHARLRDTVSRFEKSRVVMRFYDHELIRVLYPEPRWTWHRFAGRKQTNELAAEVLITNGV